MQNLSWVLSLIFFTCLPLNSLFNKRKFPKLHNLVFLWWWIIGPLSLRNSVAFEKYFEEKQYSVNSVKYDIFKYFSHYSQTKQITMFFFKIYIKYERWRLRHFRVVNSDKYFSNFVCGGFDQTFIFGLETTSNNLFVTDSLKTKRLLISKSIFLEETRTLREV